MSSIRTENLRKVFHGARSKEVLAVRGVSFEVEEGEIFVLLGANGAGKTTLLRMLGLIISPTSGQLWIAGKPSTDAPDAVRGGIGFLSGNTKLYGRLKVTEVLRYFGRLYDMPEEDITRRIGELSEMLDMEEFLDQRCDTLSTGQTQKTSISRVLLHDPPLLILDEPTLGLDIMTSRSIVQFIRDAKSRGHSVIFSTHYMAEAEALCDRIALMHRGEILAMGTLDEMYALTGETDLQSAFLSLVDKHDEAIR